MSSISFTNIQDGTTIDANDVNNPLNTIYDDYNGNITDVNIASNAAIAGSKLANNSVTPAKRTGGFFMGTIASTDLGTTGNKAITGVGFTPKRVEFHLLPTTSTAATGFMANGAMDADGRQFYVALAIAAADQTRVSNTNACIAFPTSATSTTLALSATFVSMDADGFTINVGTASSAFPVRYLAWG